MGAATNSPVTLLDAGDCATTFLSYARGHDLDGNGTIDNNDGVSPTDHKSYRSGQLVDDSPSPSDPHVTLGLLNSGGGPIADIARLSGLRNLLSQQFGVSRPSLLNGGPGLNGFTESIAGRWILR